MRVLGKADKIYLNNTNLNFAFSTHPDVGSIRETFFISQFPSSYKIELPNDSGDFITNNITFGIGGKSKNAKQIQGIPNIYLVKDNIEHGFGNSIPLWKIGFLY